MTERCKRLVKRCRQFVQVGKEVVTYGVNESGQNGHPPLPERNHSETAV